MASGQEAAKPKDKKKSGRTETATEAEPVIVGAPDGQTGTTPEKVTPAADAALTAEELLAYDHETTLLVSEAEAVAKSAGSAYENSKAIASEDKKFFEAKLADLRKLIRDRAENRGKRPAPPEPTLLDQIPRWKEYGLDKLTIDDVTLKMLTEAGIATLGDLSDQIGPAYTDEAPSFGMSRETNDSIREQIHAIIDAEFKQPKTESDLYKSYPIARWERFGLTAKDIEKLNAGETKGTATGFPIVTIGDLQRFITPNSACPGYAQNLADIKGIGAKGAERIGEAELMFWSWWRAGGEEDFAAEQNQSAPAAGSEAA